MDNLVVLHTGHALDLLEILLGHLRLLGDQLLQVLYLILQLCGLNLTHLKLHISLVQLVLEVVNIALGGGQLILSVMQLSASVVKEVSLEVTATISPHQLVVQLLDTRLKAGVLLKKLSVTLLNVLDEAVLGLHLVDILLQVEALVDASRRDLLKLGAHVLGAACHERPPRMVGRKLGVTNSGYTSLYTTLPSFRTRSKAMVVPSRTGRWCLQNSVRAWWAALSRVSSRSSPLAVVNQAAIVGSEG
jgi:hypothetical protein